MSESSKLDWVAKTEERIKQLESLDLKDRLACYIALWAIVDAIGNSVSGWRSWLVRPGLMAEFSEEELREFCVSLREMTISFLTFDIKGTQKMKVPPSPPARESEQRYWA